MARRTRQRLWDTGDGEAKPDLLVIDDDPKFRDSVARLLRTVRLETLQFSSVHDFLKADPPECQIASKCDPLFAAKNDPFDGAETGGAEPHIAEQSRSWRAASGEREVMRGS